MKGKLISTIQANPWYFIILCMTGVVFIIFGLFTTLKPDDLLYSYFIGSNLERKINSFPDFIASAWNCFFIENGRFATVLSQFFNGLMGKTFYTVCNAVVAVLYFHFTSRHIAGRQHGAAVLACTLLYALTAAPFPGQTMLWISGSTGYMWATTFTLILLWYMGNRPEYRQAGIVQLVGLFVISWVCGQMNESVSIPASFGWVAWLLFRGRKPSRVEWTALAGYVLGTTVILVSPAAWERLGNAGMGDNGTIIEIMLRHGNILVENSIHYLIPVFALLVFAFNIITQGIKSVVRDIAFWIYMGCVILLFTLGIKGVRPYFFFCTLSFIVTMRLFFEKTGHISWLMRGIALLASLACIPLAYKAFIDIKEFMNYENRIIAKIQAAPPYCVLKCEGFRSARWASVTRYDSESVTEFDPLYRQHFHKKSIAFLRDSLYLRYLQPNIVAHATPVTFASTHPHVLSTIYLFPGQSFSLIPIEEKNIDKMETWFHLHLNEKRNRNNMKGFTSYLPGELLTHNRLSYFFLNHRGKFYLVVAAVESDVQRLDLPVLIDGKKATVTLTRK